MSSKTFVGKSFLGLNLIKSVTGKPKSPALASEPEAVEDVTVLTDDASAAQRRKKKVGIRGGKQATILSGIGSALLKRKLGE
jgi:hypothetical protein